MVPKLLGEIILAKDYYEFLSLQLKKELIKENIRRELRRVRL